MSKFIKIYVIALVSFAFALSLNAMEKSEKKLEKEIYISIDSGGVLGIIPAYLLNDLQEKLGKTPIIDKVAGLAGTSTGAIIAGSLAGGISAEKIYNFYKNNTGTILSEKQVTFFELASAALNGSFHQGATHFEQLLEQSLGDKKLSDSKKFLLIMSALQNKQSLQAYPFCSDFAKNCEFNTTLRSAIRASASIPLLWPTAKVTFDNGSQGNFVDAGIIGVSINDPTQHLYDYLAQKQDGVKRIIYHLQTGFCDQAITYQENATIEVISIKPNLTSIEGYNEENMIAMNCFALNASKQNLALLEQAAQNMLDSENYKKMIEDFIIDDNE